MKNRRGSQKNITAELENGKILLLIVWLSIPAVIAQLITFLYNIVDRMYVARMDGDGMDALGAVINIVLDPIFIFRLEMGVRGSSLATVLSQFCSCLCVCLFFFTKKSLFRFRIREMRLSVGRMASILSLGVTPFVSYNYGKGDAERLKKGIRYVTTLAFFFCIVTWSVSLAVPEMYAHLFVASEEVTLIVKKFCPFFLMGSIMFFVQMTLQNVNIALGQARSALLLAVNRKVVILIPLCFMLTDKLGYRGVYLSEGIADLVAGIITSAVIFTSFPRIFQKRAELVRAMERQGN